MRIVFLGPPGAGKGTQAAALAARLGVPQVSTGDIIRAAVRAGTALGREFQAYADRGELVPDDLVNRIVQERLAQPDARPGFLLDGYPRTVPQARALDAMLADKGQPLDHVLLLDVPEEVLVERITGRRLDPETGRIYHVVYDPPPPEVAGRLVQRPDDTEEVLRTRLGEYREKTAPLIAYYDEAGLLRRVDGVGAVDEVRRRLLAAVGL